MGMEAFLAAAAQRHCQISFGGLIAVALQVAELWVPGVHARDSTLLSHASSRSGLPHVFCLSYKG